VSGQAFIAANGAGAIGARRLGRRAAPLGALRAVGRLLLLALLVSIVNAVSGLVLRWARAPEARAKRTFSRLSTMLVRLLGVVVERDGRAPPGLCVVVANHRSYVDIPLLMSAVPSVFLAKTEIAGWPLFGTSARLSRTVFVDRDDRDSRSRALAELGARLDRGERIAVFPEGTTTTGPGCSPFRTGAFRLAAARGLPVVPIAICYRDRGDAWVDDASFVGHFLDRFREPNMVVTLAIGPELRGADASELKDGAERWILERLARLDGAGSVGYAAGDGIATNGSDL
jgi:1-acyl-sn-glycerol-3-phosphate acyltransferase